MVVGGRRETLRPPLWVSRSDPRLPGLVSVSLQSLLSVNYVFPVNLTTFALQPARPRSADAGTSHPDDMGLSLSVAGPLSLAVSYHIVLGLYRTVSSEKKAFRVH